MYRALYWVFCLSFIARHGTAQDVEISTNWGTVPRLMPVCYVFFENICHRDSTMAEVQLVNKGRRAVKLEGVSFSSEVTFCDSQGNSLRSLTGQVGPKGSLKLRLKYKPSTGALLGRDVFLWLGGERYTLKCVPCYRFLRHQRHQYTDKEREVVVRRSKNCHDSLYVCFACNMISNGVSLYDKQGFYPKDFGQHEHQLYCRVNIAYLLPGRYQVRVDEDYNHIYFWDLVIEE